MMYEDNLTRELKEEILLLRLENAELRNRNGELKRLIRVQSKAMDDARQKAYEAYTSTVTAISQRFEVT